MSRRRSSTRRNASARRRRPSAPAGLSPLLAVRAFSRRVASTQLARCRFPGSVSVRRRDSPSALLPLSDFRRSSTVAISMSASIRADRVSFSAATGSRSSGPVARRVDISASSADATGDVSSTESNPAPRGSLRAHRRGRRGDTRVGLGGSRPQARTSMTSGRDDDMLRHEDVPTHGACQTPACGYVENRPGAARVRACA